MRQGKVSIWLVILMLCIGYSAVAEAATISGTVINSSGKSGRVYLSLTYQMNSDSVPGKATASVLNSGQSATYSIDGVPDGSYTLQAFVDTTGTGLRHAYDPVATTSVAISSGGNQTRDVTIMASVFNSPLTAPVGVNFVPFAGGVMVMVDNPKTSDVIVPDKYKLVCGGTTLDNIPARDNTLLVLNLTNGTILDSSNCSVTPYVNGALDSTNKGTPASPVTIGDSCNAYGTCGTGKIVSGKVRFEGAGLPGGRPLLVAVTDGRSRFYLAKVTTSGTVGTPASYSIPGVAQGFYHVYSFLDNGDGILFAPGDLTPNDRNGQVPNLYVDGLQAAVTAPDVILKPINAHLSLGVEHSLNWNPNTPDYRLAFETNTNALKQIVNVTLHNGTGSRLPASGVTLAPNNWGSHQYYLSTINRPLEGETYLADITYNDTTSETLTLKVRAVLDDFPVLTFPKGNIHINIPAGQGAMGAWRMPSRLPGTDFMYGGQMGGGSGNAWAEFSNLSPTALSAEVTDPDFINAFNPGDSGWFNFALRDPFGNRAGVGGGFTVSGTGPEIGSFSPPSGTVSTPVVITGSGFTGVTAVSFNGVTAQSFVLNSPTQITATTPANGISAGPIIVTANGVTTLSRADFKATVGQAVTITRADGTPPSGNVRVALVASNPAVIAYTTNGVDHTFSATDSTVGIPAGVPFSLRVTSDAAGYHPTYTKIMSKGGNGGNAWTWTLITDTDLASWGLTNVQNNSKGIITARVKDNNDATLAGATVSVKSRLYPDIDTPYTIKYADGNGAPSNSATYTAANGLFYVLDIDEGDTVTVTAHKSGMAFNPVAYLVHAGGVSQGSVRGDNMPTSITPTPAGGSVIAPQTVTLATSPSTTGTILYTLDGSDPQFYGTAYPGGGILLNGSQSQVTLRYVFKNRVGEYGATGSTSFDVIYDVTPPYVTATPPGYDSAYAPYPPTFSSAVFPLGVTFTVSEPATIYYTLDGSAPTTGSTSLAVTSPGGSTTPVSITAGTTLKFYGRDAANNSSTVQTWTFNSTTPISYSGFVKDKSDNTPIQNARVEMDGNPAVFTTTAADGSFTLNNLPANYSFKLRISAAGKQDAYSNIIYQGGSSNPAYAAERIFYLYTLAEMNSMGNATGNGMIRGYVTVVTGSGRTGLGGATVSITSSGGSYSVVYDNGSGGIGGSSTSSNGIFYVLNVNPYDSLFMTASKAGFTFPPQGTIYQAVPDAVTEGWIKVSTSPSTTTVSPTTSSIYGSPVTLTATVSSVISGTISGTVQFFDGATPIGGPVALSTSTANSSTASYGPVTNLAVGTHSITAAYSGSLAYGGGTSVAVNQIVNKIATTTTVSPISAINFGQAAIFTANVSPGSGTGTIQFKVDDMNFGVPVSLSGGSATSTPVSGLATGAHTVTAVYSGDSSYNASTSAGVTLTVVPDGPVKISSTSYSSMQASLDAAVNNDTILAQSTRVLTENLTVNKPGATVKISGGYDSGYWTNNGRTVIDGSLKIRNGMLRVQKLAIK